MTSSAKMNLREKFIFSSCSKSDVWHPEKDKRGFESWHFNALNDNSNEAILISFYDNFVLSPRYNSANQKALLNGNSSSPQETLFPAFTFTYYKNGKVVYRVLRELSHEDFSADTKTPQCTIGGNSFKFESAPYGSGYVISVDVGMGRNKRLVANFEWLSVESDICPEDDSIPPDAHWRNIVALRSDVTGRIRIKNSLDENLDEVNFRGTGSHDHIYDNRWIPNAVESWLWGSVHFANSSAIFVRFKELAESKPITKLFLVKNEEFVETEVECNILDYSRNLYGLKFPSNVEFFSENDSCLQIEHLETIDRSFAHVRALCEITLMINNGEPKKAIGITEHVFTKPLKNRWLDWFINFRIRRNR